jgi:hypothetical protein
MRKELIVLFVLILTLFVSSPIKAQDVKLTSATGVNFAFPIGDMSDIYDFGWGIYGDVDYNFNKFLTARLDIGWNQFSGDDITDDLGLTEEVKQTVWEFTGGLRARVSFVYAEFRGGYFTGVESWGYVPAVGLRFGKLDIQGNITIAGDNQWGGVRVAYYWGQ